jgi:hypothetical protein
MQNLGRNFGTWSKLLPKDSDIITHLSLSEWRRIVGRRDRCHIQNLKGLTLIKNVIEQDLILR